MIPNQRIDERAFKRMSQVQASRHVRRGNDNTEWFPTFSRIDFVGLVGFPNLLPFGFGCLGVVLGGRLAVMGVMMRRFASIYDCATVGMLM